jgi:hypothetical protein
MVGKDPTGLELVTSVGIFLSFYIFCDQNTYTLQQIRYSSVQWNCRGS